MGDLADHQRAVRLRPLNCGLERFNHIPSAEGVHNRIALGLRVALPSSSARAQRSRINGRTAIARDVPEHDDANTALAP